MASADRTHMQKHVKKLFLLSQLQYIISIDTRKAFYSAHIKPNIDYVLVAWDGCGEVHFKKLNSLHRRIGKLIIPDPSLSTEQKMSVLWILNLLQQLTYSKGIVMHNILIIPQTTWHNSSFVTSPTTVTPGINLYMPRPRLDLFKTSISFAGASLWNSPSRNIKSCISLPCFKRNLHQYIFENNILLFGYNIIELFLRITFIRNNG